MKKKYQRLRLLLGDQLNPRHSWFKVQEPDTLYVLMEVRSETDYVWHHIQKVCAFFEAMRQFADTLAADGHETVYIKLDDPENKQAFSANCKTLIKTFGIKEFQYQLPDEYRLDLELKNLCKELHIPSRTYDTEHFYTTREELGILSNGKTTLVMETFYREMRRKYKILVNGTEPEQGKWNFDEENRKKIPKNHVPPAPFLFNNDVSEIYSCVKKVGIKTIGSVDSKNFYWPVNRAQSLKLLKHFVEHCLPLFGTFQDAMHTEEWSLYHSRISFSMNIKMLSPKEVIEAAITKWSDNKSHIAINQIEGFVRQIIGWREYMRGIYWLKMPSFEDMNYFDCQRKLPAFYWTGKTRMKCMRHSISQSLQHAYAHHIQRLMITGNFALLTGIRPDEVDSWYLGIYIDAIQWVEITNTRGMSQYADGGITGTKPYTASANYIHKMSNYCDGCFYDRKQKTGSKSCPFNSLYWDFHDRHRAKLENNPRLSLVYRAWDKMDVETREQILLRADDCLTHLEEL